MTTGTATAVQRSGPEILAVLTQHAPREATQFGSELRDALARAAGDLDVARVDEVMARWHTRVCILANPLSEQEQTLLRRARAGDFSRLRARRERRLDHAVGRRAPSPHRLLWLELAERQYLDLPDDARALVDQRLIVLEPDPAGLPDATYAPHRPLTRQRQGSSC